MRAVKFVIFIFDAAFVDPFRQKSRYQKDTLTMTWADFWALSEGKSEIYT